MVDCLVYARTPTGQPLAGVKIAVQGWNSSGEGAGCSGFPRVGASRYVYPTPTDSSGHVLIKDIWHPGIVGVCYKFEVEGNTDCHLSAVAEWKMFDYATKEVTVIGQAGVPPPVDGGVTIQALGDDGKGNVSSAITVGDGQKFWIKGYMKQDGKPYPNALLDVWFDEYGPDPPYPYIKSWWLSTQVTNQDGYFDQSPYDVEWLKKVGTSPDGYPILQLWQAKKTDGPVWQGKVRVNLGFKVTQRGL